MTIQTSAHYTNCFMNIEKFPSRTLFNRQALIIVITLQLILGSIPTTNSAEVSSKYTGSLTSSSPTFIRPGQTTGRYYYAVIQVAVSTSGLYTFSSTSSIDTFGCLYSNMFNSSNPQNSMICNDDGASNNQFILSASLQYTRLYFLVVTTYSESIRGDFLVEAKGPDQLDFPFVVSYSTSTAVFNAAYSGALFTSSPVFTRPNGNGGDYFYQAIEVTVPLTGTYRLSSNAAIDMYGCLYDYSFGPSYPNLWLVCDDDGARNGQFLISYRLESSRTYILVVTTYAASTTASYLINTSGPARLSLTSTSRTTSFPRRTSTSWSYSAYLGYQTWKIPVIIGSTIGGIGFFVILVAVFIYYQKQKSIPNQMFPASVSSQNSRAQNVPMRSMYPNPTEVNRPPASYTIPMSAMNNTYLESYPPSYDAYVSSLKQSNQGAPTQY